MLASSADEGDGYCQRRLTRSNTICIRGADQKRRVFIEPAANEAAFSPLDVPIATNSSGVNNCHSNTSGARGGGYDSVTR